MQTDKHYLQQRNINLFNEFIPKAPEAKPVKGKAKTK